MVKSIPFESDRRQNCLKHLTEHRISKSDMII